MSAIQELQPYCDAFQGRIREAKENKHYTLQRLIDESGVPKSAVNNISAGKQVNPLLYNAAALCKVLGLSLDELFGLEKPVDSPEGQQQRIHELELDNTRLIGDAKLSAAVDEQKDKRLETARIIVGALTSVSVLLLLVVIGYMVLDAHILNTGLFRSAGVSVFFVFLVLLVIAALAAIGYALRFLFRK